MPPTEGRAPRKPRSGFMLLVALIAVAIAGLIMVSTSPDLSGAAASLKSRELSLSLGTIRRALSAKPLYLTTTDFTYNDADNLAHDYHTGDYLSTDILEYKLRQLTIGEQLLKSPDGKLGAGATFLTTIPVDPYVPLRDWYNPGHAAADPNKNLAGIFWGASYNAVRNPTFRSGTALEAYVNESLVIYHMRKNAEAKDEIWRSDRFGENGSAVVTFRGADNRAPAISPDGSRVAFQSSRLNGWDIYVVSDDGSLETQITNTAGAIWETAPIWAPQGDRLAYIKETNGVADSSALIVCSASGANPTQISTGVMTIYPNHAWSPDSRWIAYAYKKPGMTNPRLALYDTLLQDHKLGGKLGENGPEVSQDCNLSFSPNSNDVLYGTPGSGSAAELWVKPELKTNPVDSIPTKVSDSGDGPFWWASWIPDSVRPASNVTGRWIVYAAGDSGKGRFPNPPYVARQRVPRSGETQQPYLVSKTSPIDPKTVSLSQFGSQLAYENATHTVLLRSAIDGAWEDAVLPRVTNGAPPVPVTFTGTTAFGATRDFWVLPPANTQLVNSSNHASFDANAWRAFVNSQADFDGDNRFGTTYLRLTPPGRQKNFVVDNGIDAFTVLDDPGLRGQGHAVGKRFPGNVSCSWSPRGLTIVGRSSSNKVGSAPIECFKVAVDVAATAVKVTTGFEPAVSPDDRWVVASRPRTLPSSDVPARTVYPIPDMDLWIANNVGAPEPPEFNLTPGTQNSQERAPCWSPDGRYIYYQRETQEQNPFLGNHNSTIWRITKSGGAATEVVGNSQCLPFWNDGSQFRSRVELYAPSVSPDGQRLAFIGKERILNSVGAFTAGDIIGEMIYVKDLYFNKEPVLLLRSAHPSNPNQPPSPSTNQDYSFATLSWSPNGEEIFAVRMQHINRRFPQVTDETHTLQVRPTIDGVVPAAIPLPDRPDYYPTSSEVIRVVPRDPSTSEHGTAAQSRSAGQLDPAGDNFTTLMSSGQVGMTNGDQILHATHSYGAYAYQRLGSDRPILQAPGISSDVWYVLSGYVRTSPSANHWHRGQIMTQLFNNRGLMIAQAKNSMDFESGLVDLGGPNWSRFSAALKFDAGLFSTDDIPPYTMNLMLYSTSEDAGSFVEFTGLKLEKAFDQEERYPTAFSSDWTIFSASKEPDPSRPGYFLFER